MLKSNNCFLVFHVFTRAICGKSKGLFKTVQSYFKVKKVDFKDKQNKTVIQIEFFVHFLIDIE